MLDSHRYHMIEIPSWLLAALFLFALISLVVLLQDRFIYFPPRYSPAELQEAKNLGVQEVRFRPSQGNQSGFFGRSKGSETTPQNVWIVFGGNGAAALGWIDLVRDFPDPCTGFLLVDYPGYGICEGKPNPRSILENTEHALQAHPEIYVFYGDADEVVPVKMGRAWIRAESNSSKYLALTTTMLSRWLFRYARRYRQSGSDRLEKRPTHPATSGRIDDYI